MSANHYSITIRKGSTLRIEIPVDDTLATVVGVTFRYRVWKKVVGEPGPPVFTLTNGPNLTTTDTPSKLVTVIHSQIALSADVYDWELFCDLAGSEGVIVEGDLTILPRPS